MLERIWSFSEDLFSVYISDNLLWTGIITEICFQLVLNLNCNFLVGEENENSEQNNYRKNLEDQTVDKDLFSVILVNVIVLIWVFDLFFNDFLKAFPF